MQRPNPPPQGSTNPPQNNRPQPPAHRQNKAPAAGAAWSETGAGRRMWKSSGSSNESTSSYVSYAEGSTASEPVHMPSMSPIDRNRIQTQNRLKSMLDPDNRFHVLMQRLCRSAFKKDFVLLDENTPSRVTVIESSSESTIDFEVLQSDFLCLNPEIVDPSGDRDFPPDEYRKMMRGGEPYFVPAGWTRIGLKVDDMPRYNRWCVAFNGRRMDNRNSLLKNGILLPGQLRPDGSVVLRRFTRAVTSSQHSAHSRSSYSHDALAAPVGPGSAAPSAPGSVSSRQDGTLGSVAGSVGGAGGYQEEVSQSVHYAALYAQPHGLERTYVQLMFQVLVDASCVKKGYGKMAAAVWPRELPFDPNFSSREIEWVVTDPNKIVCTGLLFREIPIHPFDFSLQRQQSVAHLLSVRRRSRPYVWLYNLGTPDAPEWVRFPQGVQELMNFEWQQGYAVSSTFRLDLNTGTAAPLPPPTGAAGGGPEGGAAGAEGGDPSELWEVLFCMPVVRRVADHMVWLPVSTVGS